YGHSSRIDLLLQCPKRGLCYVEVKNVHLSRRHGVAEFPDSVTARGVKHLSEMSAMVRQGHRAVMVFLIQRSEVNRLTLARDIDPAYGDAFDAAYAAGVEAIALRCRVGTDEIVVDRLVPITGLIRSGLCPAQQSLLTRPATCCSAYLDCCYRV